MDQFIRSLGNYRTHYGITAESAIRLFSSHEIDVVITEFELSDSNAFHLIRELRKVTKKPVHIILAVDSTEAAHEAIADELGVDGILKKPFTARDIQTQIEAYKGKGTERAKADRLLFDGDRALANKDAQAAALAYQNSLKIAETTRGHCRMGHYFLLKRDFDSAEKHFHEALRINSACVPAIEGLGLHALKKGNYPLANDYLSEAQNLSPLNPSRPILLARLRAEWGREELKRASLKFPRDEELLFELGKFLVFEKDYAAAVRLLRDLKLPAGDPNAKDQAALVALACKLGSIK